MSESRPAAAHDFVDRLVMKTLGAADLPVPRLPSIYEPPRPLRGSELAGTGDLDGAAESEWPRAQRAVHRRLDRSSLDGFAFTERALASPHAASEPASVTDANHRHLPAAPLDTGHPPSVVDTKGPTQPRRAVDGSSRDAASPPREDTPHEALRTASRPRAPESRLTFERGSGSAHPRRGAAAALTSEWSGREADNVAGHREQRIASNAESPAEEAVLVPRASGLALRPGGDGRRLSDRSASRHDGDDTAARAGIAVNVTIGRVEVRATPAAEPFASRSRPRGPQPLPLQEYLDQRGVR